jgi:hypothetical protein
MESLSKLAELVKEKNRIEESISQIISRPAFIGHFGEYIAAKVFNIQFGIWCPVPTKDKM